MQDTLKIRPRLEVISLELARRGWSKTEFARRLNTPLPYLSAILNGHQQPGLELRTRMQAVLKLEFDDLFEAVPPEATVAR